MGDHVSEPPTGARGRVPPGGGAAGGDPVRPRRIWVAARDEDHPGRTSPYLRFDLLQLVAWAIGLAMVVLGLVAIARAGFAEIGLFDPVVEVAGLAATPLLALLWLLVGVLLIAAATGEVDDRGLRITGVVLGVVGVVWAVEPGAFEPYLGISARAGIVLLAKGAALTAASFVPPLATRRPGV